MSLSKETIAAWRDRGFQLRGVSAIYRETHETTNTETGAITRNDVDLPVTVLRSGEASSESADITFRVRLCELPDERPRRGNRIVVGRNEYIINGWETDQSQTVTDLVCRRV